MNIKSFAPHIIAVVIAVIAVFAYNYPALQGKVISQHDIVSSLSASSELREFRDANGTEALWTNSQFGGMPSFGMSTHYPSNLMVKIEDFTKGPFPSKLGLLVALVLGCYFLLITLGVDWRLAIIGGLAFAFSTYFLVSFESGHTGKLRTTGYIAPVLAGVLMAYRGRWLLGGAIACLFTALALQANHPQISYYMGLLLLVVGIFELVNALRNQHIKGFVVASAVLVVAAGIGVTPNTSKLWSVYEYSKETIRGGKSELSAKAAKTESGGLDIDYAFGWSYGIGETFTLLVPDVMGGASGVALDENSATYDLFVKNGRTKKQALEIVQRMPMYWGDQPFTSGPAYIGAIFVFLFVLGLLVVDPRYRWWLFAATVLAIVLSWGRNFLVFNQLMFDYFPMYNKFRAPTMVLTLASLTMVTMSILAINALLKAENRGAMAQKILIAGGITGGLALLVSVVGPGLASFKANGDARYIEQGQDILVQAFREDRASMMRSSGFKSFFLIAVSTGALWAFATNKVNEWIAIGVIGVVGVGDLMYEGQKYLNEDDYVTEKAYEKQFLPDQTDQQILQDNDAHYRVWNLSQPGGPNPWNDALTSAHHKHLGGYSAVKLIRIQDLFERHLQKDIAGQQGTSGSRQIFDMFNVKYMMLPGQQGGPVVQPRPSALGNAWFVNELQWVPNADEEMAALADFSPNNTALVDERFRSYFDGDPSLTAAGSTIELTSYAPNELIYKANVSGGEQFAVFSEMYYEGHDNDWKVYIDNEPASHIRVNYALRGMSIPEGEHEIRFFFKPATWYTGETYSLIGSLVVLLLLGAGIALDRKGKGRLQPQELAAEEV